MELTLVPLAYADLHFLAIADWGGLPVWPYWTPGQRKVARAMGRVAERFGSSFALTLGDHFYFSGVKSADDPRWRRTFERVFSHPMLQGAGFWRAVAGNHDHDGNISAQLAYSARNGSRWHYPALQHRWREKLPTDEGTVVDIVLIDTVLLCGPPGREVSRIDELAARSWAWVEAALEDSADADYLIVAGHYPVHSPSSHGPTRCLRRRLEPLLIKFQVAAYFSGHDHAMFHIGGAGSQFHGVGAGFMLSSSRKHVHTIPPAQLHFFRRARSPLRGVAQGGFAGVSVSAAALTIRHYDESGRVLHQATVLPRPRRPAQASPAKASVATSGASHSSGSNVCER